MDLTQLEACLETKQSESLKSHSHSSVSLETEIPEALFSGMKDFLSSNPHWDQYELMSSALANFLFQNGCQDRSVAERYLNDLFGRTNA